MASSTTKCFAAALFLSLISEFVYGDDKPKVPAVYVFGDSTVDVGNNNYLTVNGSKANFLPNGIDFPFSRPTGRFSNGYNGVDFLVSLMGFKRSPPPFLSLANTTNHKIKRGLHGVNFASGGSGILESTGNTITMSKQIKDFTSFQSNLKTRMGMKQASRLISESVFIISTGGNDIFGYFSKNRLSNNFENTKFITLLISTYKSHIQTLYSYGARKFGVINVAPIGCCPYPRSLNPSGDCIEVLNKLAKGLNEELKILMQNLSLSLRGMKYSIGNSYEVVWSVIKNPQALGFKEAKAACCGDGRFNAQSGCKPNSTLCSDRRGFVFWDGLHPTHAMSKLAGEAIYNGQMPYAFPINFKQLSDYGN